MKKIKNFMGNMGARPKDMIKGEKGAAAYEKTDNPCVDLFFQVVPDSEPGDAEKYFTKAWEDDPELALKVLFNFGNVRKDGGGKNDEKNFARAMIWLWRHHPKTFLLNLHMIPEHASLKMLLDLCMYILHYDLADSPYNLETKLVMKVKHRETKGKICKKRKWKAKRDAKKMRKEEYKSDPKQLKQVRETLIREYKEMNKNQKQKVKTDTRTHLKKKFGEHRDTNEAVLRDMVAKIIADGLSKEFTQLVQARGGKATAKEGASGRCPHISGLYAKWAPTKNHQHDKATRIVHTIVPMLLTEVRDQIDQVPEFGQNRTELKQLISLQSQNPDKSVAHLYKDDERLRSVAESTYQKTFLANIRRATEVPEHFTGTNEFEKVNFGRMPSRCRFLFGQKLYQKKAKTQYDKYLFDASKNQILGKKSGKKITINSILPHEITLRARNSRGGGRASMEDAMSEKVEINLQWIALVQSMREKIKEDQNFGQWIPLCDTSGSMGGYDASMGGSAMDVACALSLLMAESTKVDGNPWGGKVLTFAGRPKLIEIHNIPEIGAANAKEKLRNANSLQEMESLLGDLNTRMDEVYRLPWEMNTNLEAAFDEVLMVCKNSPLTKEQVSGIKICIFSDMEFDQATGRENKWTTMHEHARKKFKHAGYPDLPTIVYWNLRASRSIPVADTNTKGVSLLSGYSAGLMRKFLNGQLELTKEIEVDPEDMESEEEEEEMDTDEKTKEKKEKPKKEEKGEKKKIKVELTPMETLLNLLDMEMYHNLQVADDDRN